MGEAKRRRQFKVDQQTLDQFLETTRTPGWTPETTSIGKYSLEFYIVNVKDAVAAGKNCALAGITPEENVRAVFGFLDALKHAEEPPLCWACDDEISLRNLHNVAVTKPFFAEACDALLSGICNKCSVKSDDEIKALVLKRWKGTWEMPVGRG